MDPKMISLLDDIEHVRGWLLNAQIPDEQALAMQRICDAAETTVVEDLDFPN